MSHSPIADLVDNYLRRVRALRVEFEDERARLEAKGDELLAAAQAAEAAQAIDTGQAVEAARATDTGQTVEAARATDSGRAAEQAVEQVVQQPGAEPSLPVYAEVVRREEELREAREAIARSAAARRANERFEPVDYDGYDPEGEYFRRKSWLE